MNKLYAILVALVAVILFSPVSALADGFRCPQCESDGAWLTRRGLMHCRRCGYQASITAGTLFQDSRSSLRVWFQAM